MFRRIPIRLRLALAFTALLAVVLVGVGLLLHWRLGETLEESLVDELEIRHEELAAVTAQQGALLEPGDPTLVEREEGVTQLLSPDGEVLFQSGTAGGPLIGPATLSRASTGPVVVREVPLPGADDPYRLLAGPVSTPQGERILVVGRSTEDIREAMAGLSAQLLLGGPLILAAGFVLAYLLTGAALRPVEAMRRRAARIESADPSQQLPVPPGHDEIARLGATLNELLARIAASVQREKSFVADAGHELRTPLAALRMELDLALRRARTREELEAALRSASTEAERLTRLAEDLLTLGRAEEGSVGLTRSRFPVHHLLTAVADRFQPRAAQEGRKVAVLPGVPDLAVSGDRSRLEQAVGNLVDNALRHGGGRVLLTAEDRDATLRIVVTDAGSGFDEHILPTAFDRFSQGDPSRAAQGVGLGLAIVRAVAQAHGGSAHVRNLGEGGAQAVIEIPACPRA